MATSEDAFPPGRSSTAHTLRLTFEYRGNDIRLTECRRVEMVTPPAVTQAPKPGQSGYWVQLTDASGRVVHHRALRSPIAIDVEVFSPDRKQSIARVPIARREGQFTVLLPDLPDAALFALHGPLDPERPSEPAQELLRLPVDAIRKFRSPPLAGQSGPGTPERN